jgi:polysaccharide biosynthesis transport protein
MSMSKNIETPAGISPADIYFVVFRHKWKIIILTLAGMAAAAAYYFTRQPLYQSEAELFIRYVTDARALNPSENNSRVTSLIDLNQNVMNSEMAMLTSFDLAAKVATNIGPEKILAKLGGGSDATTAAFAVKMNLSVESLKDSSVVRVTFQHADPGVVQPVLAEIIADYLEKHEQVHSSIGMSDDALQDKTTQLRLAIAQTEDELRMAKTNAGIISVDDAENSYSAEMKGVKQQLFEAELSLQEHQASLNELTVAAEAKGGTNNPVANHPVAKVTVEQMARYQSACERVAYLEHRQNDYLQQGFTDQNKLVQDAQASLVEAAKAKAELEAQYPALVETDAPIASPSPAPPPARTTDSGQATSLPVKIKVLKAELIQIQGEAAKLDEAEAKIADLERVKKIQEGTFDYFATYQDQAHIDEQLGADRNSNISEIQTPCPPYKEYGKFFKTMAALVFGGLLAGLAWAFLIEYYLDRSIKRPVDLQSKLRIPFFLSIPDLNHNNRSRLAAKERRQLEYGGNKSLATTASGALEIASPLVNHALHSHYDALRDRLVNYFESINLTRKPKLVAITSPGKGAGVSTIAAGLAASLSETGDGRVLLVDMNLENGAAQQFVRGKFECKLDDALISEKRDHALVQENLYVVSEGSTADTLPRILPRRFASLVPKLKASDYDYIIFDMPPVTQTSVTTRLAGFMDTVMLVVESEKTDRDVVQQANQLLLQSKANVTAILNKTRQYVPARLHHDINADV